MIWFVLFLIGGGCALMCAAALLLWLGFSVVQGVIRCREQLLTNLSSGHVIPALLYVIPTGLFLYALIDGLRLAFSFYMTVFK